MIDTQGYIRIPNVKQGWYLKASPGCLRYHPCLMFNTQEGWHPGSTADPRWESERSLEQKKETSNNCKINVLLNAILSYSEEMLAIAHDPIVHKPIITPIITHKRKNIKNSLGKSRCNWQWAIPTVRNWIALYLELTKSFLERISVGIDGLVFTDDLIRIRM